MDQRDLLIKNGKILCMDGDVRADWLLTQGGKIARLGVGKRDPEYISGTVQIIDAGGRTVLPGFIDNHFQVVRTGLECGYVDLSHVRNYDEIGQIIRREAASRSVSLPAGWTAAAWRKRPLRTAMSWTITAPISRF